MRSTLASFGLLALVLGGCQNEEYVTPVDNVTGTPPRDATTIFEFDAAAAPAFVGPDLERANAVTAAFVNTEAGITPMPVAGLLPGTVGNEANLLAGVGFGTYPNPDYRGPGGDWDSLSPFASVLEANVTLNSTGDTVTFCRSFATTCIDIVREPPGAPSGINVVIVRLAANIPDTEIGEIQPGISAAIRGTGDNGLTIAITDQDTVGLPFLVPAGTAFDVTWTVERGAVAGSIDWSVAINGNEIGSGNNIVDMADLIETTGGVGLIFDTPLGDSPDGERPVSVDYSYLYNGVWAGMFDDPTGLGVPISPQPGLGYAPLFVYPTTDPDWGVGTMTGYPGTPHAVQPEDGVHGLALEPDGASGQHFVYSVAFNGDDFASTPAAGLIDWGIAGGGFYASPTFCYSQILPLVEAQVVGGVRAETHRQMWANIGNGTAGADAALPGLVGALGSLGATVTYTPLGGTGISAYAAFADDFADNNVDTMLTTSATETFAPVLTEAAHQTFVSELGAIVAALMFDTGGGVLRWQLIAGADPEDDFDSEGLAMLQLQLLLGGLTSLPGIQDGVVLSPEEYGGSPVLLLDDDWPPFDGFCNGYDCIVASLQQDIVLGTNDSGRNPTAGVPGLGATCLWGLPPSAEVPESSDTITGDPATDHPGYPAVPAAPPTVPVREQAALSMNELILGVYGNFYTAIMGPGVPASNFSVAMTSGDPGAAAGPMLSTLLISSEASSE